MKYTVIVWYHTVIAGEQERDFETYEVEAVDEPQAKRRALDQHKKGIPFKTEII